jgi:hypothetical protein
MAGNAATEADTRSGEAVLKFSRKSTEKIDGIIATCMALAVDMVRNEEFEWYIVGQLALWPAEVHCRWPATAWHRSTARTR